MSDFNQVTAGTTSPIQHVIDPTAAGSIFKKRTCTYNDGANGCWAQKMTGDVNKR